MVFDSEEEAKKIYNKIISGIEFEKVTGRYLVRTYIRQKNGNFKASPITFPENKKPVFAEKACKMKLKEVSEPFSFIDENGQNKYALIKCVNILPEKQLTYEEAKKTIEEKFKNFYRNKLEKETEKKLAEKYHPKYYYDVLEEIISKE